MMGFLSSDISHMTFTRQQRGSPNTQAYRQSRREFNRRMPRRTAANREGTQNRRSGQGQRTLGKNQGQVLTIDSAEKVPFGVFLPAFSVPKMSVVWPFSGFFSGINY
jgi:hypothetical protein